MTSEFAIAVHALVFLNHKGDTQNSEKIAENVCTNSARVRKVLAKLKQADLICTREGASGGCYLDKQAEEITLEEICRAVKDTPVYVSKKTGDPDMNCQIASGMADVMESIYADLNKRCFRGLREITIADIDQKLLGGK